jgi:hypothetical protein
MLDAVLHEAAKVAWRGAWATVRGAKDTRPQNRAGDLADFVRDVARALDGPPGRGPDDKDGPAILGTTFRTGRGRRVEDVVSVGVVGLDLDHGAPDPEAVAIVFGAAAIIHSSYNDGRPKGPDRPEPRYRMLLPLARAVSVEEFRAVRQWAAVEFRTLSGCTPDPGCADPNRVWYCPRRRTDVPDPAPWLLVYPGEPLDPDNLPDGECVSGLLALRATAEDARPSRTPALDAVRNVRKGGRTAALKHAAAADRGRGADDDAIRAGCTRAAANCNPSLESDEPGAAASIADWFCGKPQGARRPKDTLEDVLERARPEARNVYYRIRQGKAWEPRVEHPTDNRGRVRTLEIPAGATWVSREKLAKKLTEEHGPGYSIGSVRRHLAGLKREGALDWTDAAGCGLLFTRPMEAADPPVAPSASARLARGGAPEAAGLIHLSDPPVDLAERPDSEGFSDRADHAPAVSDPHTCSTHALPCALRVPSKGSQGGRVFGPSRETSSAPGKTPGEWADGAPLRLPGGWTADAPKRLPPAPGWYLAMRAPAGPCPDGPRTHWSKPYSTRAAATEARRAALATSTTTGDAP